ncbi:MAG: glycosyltransferase family 4 protein [Methanosarcinaceae archaeon]|nr:glycosyltransferase family 4 protein [Methanosarcinaceae archaeon]MDF1534209.1 glycosyltransferase family 4 protein [Methanosarcinaceae archaeon]
MKKLRIGMFAWESLYSIKVGGIAPHVSELSEALAAKGHEVHIFTRSGGLGDYEMINGVHYHMVTHDQSGNIVYQMDRMCDAMYSRFLDVRENGEFDVLHGHDWHPVNVLCRIKTEFGVPFVITYHSTEWGRNGNQYGSWWEAQEISHREWLGGFEAKEVISTSTILTDEIQHLYQIPDSKITKVPNGIYAGKIRKIVDAGKVKESIGIHLFAPVVLFIGRMSYQKGPDLLVEAIPQVLRDNWGAHFVFVGEGEMRHNCEDIANKSGVSGACHFLGYASDETARDWYNACDIVCVPSRNEPFGIVVLEAWDAGKPVVATDAVRLVDNFKTGINVFNNSDSIAWGINYMIGRLAKNSYGKEGRRMVETLYDWKTIADATLDVYGKVV